MAKVPSFLGNVEGRDIPRGTTDVVVTDGFTGNVALKVLEGLAATLFGEIRGALTSGFMNRMAAAVVAPSIRALRARIDPDTYGGAPLLGVDGVCVIGHGSASARAIANGIGVSARAARGQLTDTIAKALTQVSAG